MKHLVVAVSLAALSVAACASESTAPEAPETTEARKGGTGRSSADPGREGEKARDAQNADKRERGDGDRRKGAPRKPNPDGGGPGAGGGQEDGSGARGSGARGSGGGDGEGAVAAYPAAGSYTFAQSGYEEFCDTAGNCDRQKLPERQPLSLAYERRTGSSAVVVSEQKASRSRVARTWTRFTPSGAHVTKLYVRFEYSGFSFERTYVPEPPVETLRFPFRSGAGWAGRWRASTSGSYRVEVGGPGSVSVGRRNVDAYRVDTDTEFRGDFEGKSRITTYVDPSTKAIVAAKGVLNVTSQFGRYTTVFDTRLIDGPGY